jgi:hypothetical protein
MPKEKMSLRGADGNWRVWVRSFDSLELRFLAGTEGVNTTSLFGEPLAPLIEGACTGSPFQSPGSYMVVSALF